MLTCFNKVKGTLKANNQKLKLIVAHDSERGIGLNNEIPWFIPGELSWVAKTTKRTSLGKKINALIMGLNTWNSLPKEKRPLKDRINIVLSSKVKLKGDNLISFSSMEEALRWIAGNNKIESAFIFGGMSIYKLALEKEWVDEAIITEVLGSFCADTFFPTLPSYLHFEGCEKVKYGDTIVSRNYYSR